MPRTVEQILKETISNCIALEAQMINENETLKEINEKLTAKNERLTKELESAHKLIADHDCSLVISYPDFSPIESKDMEAVAGLKADS